MKRRTLTSCILVSALSAGCGASTDIERDEGVSFAFPLVEFAEEVDRGNAAWTDLSLVIVGSQTTEAEASEVWVSMNGDGVILQATSTGDRISSTYRTWGDSDAFHGMLAACAADRDECATPTNEELLSRWEGFEWSMMLGDDELGYYGEQEETALVFLPLLEDLAD